tara:strand:+ start:173 stop:373 length:201 start_codon:yes stop_codon:yes gene_type:complete
MYKTKVMKHHKMNKNINKSLPKYSICEEETIGANENSSSVMMVTLVFPRKKFWFDPLQNENIYYYV